MNIVVCAFVLLFAASTLGLQDSPPLLLVDTEKVPHASIAWAKADGKMAKYEKDLPYASDAERVAMGANVEGFVAVGGARLAKGAGHPRGAVVRVGFYKLDPTRAFFDQITADSAIEVTLSGVVMNQPALPRRGTVVAHVKYALEAMKSCQISSDAFNLFLTSAASDTLNGRIRPGYDTRLGALSGSVKGDGVTELVREADGSITMRARVPYALFKHILDPWQRAIPGTFIEPQHFHLEFEILPEAVALELEAAGPETLPRD